jgi:hypothetical protein
MRKKLIGALAVCAVLGAVAVPANAEASTYCGIGKVDHNRSGYTISYKGARANGMNCASVRYALSRFRAKVRRQYGYPRMPRAFFDGWVTWHCRKTSRHGIKCWEGTSNTSYRFRAYVW